MRSGRVVLLAWMLGAGAANADDCRAIEDVADRLACYDRLATPDEESTTPQAALVSADAGGEARTQPGNEEAGVARPGPLRRVLGAIKLPKPKPVNVVASGKIVRVRELARGNFELELDSGEVWRENEREMRTNYRIGDMVVISSGMLGTFNLDNERSGQRTKARKVR